MTTPASAPLTDGEIDVLVRRYVREMARYEETGRLVEDRLRRELREHTIKALLSSRAKHPGDLRGKLAKNRGDARYTFASLNENINDVVTDLAGCRIMVYRRADVENAERVVRESLGIAHRNKAVEQKDLPSGYRAIHILVQLDPWEERESLRGAICEVQIASMSAHVFNELEHDVVYKDHDIPPSAEEIAILEDLLHAVRLADSTSERLMAARAVSKSRRTVRLKDAEELRFALESAAGRPLHGEFALLFDLLDTSVLPLTAGALADLGKTDELLTRGQERAATLGITDTDDAVLLALSLFDRYADGFEEIVRQRGGPSTLLKRAIDRASAQRKGAHR